jgi:hypothetical protein
MCFSKWTRLLLLSLAISQLPLSSSGQEKIKTANTTRETQRVLSAEEQDALMRARQLASYALSLESREERVKFLVRLSDIVWEWDDALARRLILQSFDSIIDDSKVSHSKPVQESSANPDLLLRQIISLVARHDPQMARQLAEKQKSALAIAAEDAPLRNTSPEQTANFMLAEAARFIGKDKARVEALFGQSVTTRVLPAHCYFLLNLRKRDAELADRLFAVALDALASRRWAEANEVLVLSSYLFSPDDSIGYDLVGGYNAANVSSNVNAAPKNPALARQYLALVSSRLNADETTPAAVVYFALKNLLPQFKAVAPKLVNDVYGKVSGLESSISQKDRNSYDSSFSDRTASSTDTANTWEERLRKADKIDNENLRDLEYFTIVNSYLVPKKDIPRALNVADRINNSVLKDRLGDYLYLLQVQDNTRRPEATSFGYESTYEKIKDPMVEVLALCEMARANLQRKDLAGVNRFLGRATTASNHISDDQQRLQAQLLIAQFYLTADPPQGFAAAARAFQEINKSGSFDMWRSDFTLTMSVYGLTNQIPLSTPFLASIISTVERMCLNDCAEAFITSGVLEDKSRRLWATLRAVDLSLAQGKKLREARNLKRPAVQP